MVRAMTPLFWCVESPWLPSSKTSHRLQYFSGIKCVCDTLAVWSIFKVSEGSTQDTESNSLEILNIPISTEQSMDRIYCIYFYYLSPEQTYCPSSYSDICCDRDIVKTFQVSVAPCQWWQGHFSGFMYSSLPNQSNYALRFNYNYNFIWLCSL